ncbi:acyltransferase [Clostridium sp. C1]|uniref:acyltransferase n=1 Tax=Clostridium sp. C1 TaxID=1155388 RepID=UPI001BAA22D2|nr:acyltransferase [Clostridium sp. C1]QUN12893.1 acyltransferase [Clostridium sp. C1]
MSSNFYTVEELKQIGFKAIGQNVKISKKASIYSPHKIELGSNVRIDDFCILSGNIKIGNYVHISASVLLFGAIEGIEINDFCSISSRTAIYSCSDDYSGEALCNPMVKEKYRKVTNKPVILKKHVIIGTGSTILPGVILEEGVSIGTMSLVNKTLEAWYIYAGIPAKKLKKRKKLYTLEEKFLEEENE